MVGFFRRHRALSAVSSGAALAFALPTVFPIVGRTEILPGGALTPLAYFALVPLIVSVDQSTPRARFGLGMLSSLAYYTVAIWWIHVAMHTFGGIPTVVTVPVLYLLFAYMAVYWGLALVADHAIRESFPKLPQWLTLGAAFTAFEIVRNYLFSGFPWANVGYLLARDRATVQWASLFGVYGLAFLVIASNAALAALLRPGSKRGAALVLAAVLVVPRLWGFYRLRVIDAEVAAAPKAKVAVVQGNIDQKIKNAAKGGVMDFGAYRDFVLGRYLPLSREADAQGADVIFWPEASYPGTLPLHPTRFPDILGAPFRAPILIGGVTAGRRPDGRVILTNSAFLVEGKDRVEGEYQKHHLVPFGEYVPLEKALHLPIHKVVPDVGFFDPGEELKVMEVKTQNGGTASFGPMICFDAIFPEIGVDFGRQDPSFLVNVTNDAWYGISSAAYQFLSIVSLRAVETGREFARAANTGISAFVDPAGRILQSLPLGIIDSDEADLSADKAIPPQMLIAEVPELHGRTVYVVIGDSFAYLCALFTAAFWVLAKRRRTYNTEATDAAGRTEGTAQGSPAALHGAPGAALTSKPSGRG